MGNAGDIHVLVKAVVVKAALANPVHIVDTRPGIHFTPVIAGELAADEGIVRCGIHQPDAVAPQVEIHVRHVLRGD